MLWLDSDALTAFVLSKDALYLLARLAVFPSCLNSNTCITYNSSKVTFSVEHWHVY